MPAPIHYRWDGEAMVPLRRYEKLCDDTFVIGETYRLELYEERSGPTHRHQFAWLKEAWLSLPETMAGDPITLSPEHLRKHALIRTGWCDVQTFHCASKAEAIRWAQNLRPLGGYSETSVAGTVVVLKTARSQSVRSMGKDEFNKSKSDILDYISSILGVSSEQLQQQKGAA